MLVGHKKAVIKPTKDPIVLNLQGQRATKAAVHLQAGGGVLFGDQALAAQARKPAETYVHLDQLLGHGDYAAGPAAEWFSKHGFGLAPAEGGKLGKPALASAAGPAVGA